MQKRLLKHRENEDKDYHDLDTIEKMYQYYLEKREEQIAERKQTKFLKDKAVKDALVLQLHRFGREYCNNGKKVDDEEWETLCKNPLSFEDFKTALIYDFIIKQELVLDILDPTNHNYHMYLIEDTIDELFG